MKSVALPTTSLSASNAVSGSRLTMCGGWYGNRSVSTRGPPSVGEQAEILTAPRVLHGCSIDLVGLSTELAADDERAARRCVSVLGAARSTDGEPRVWIRASTSAPTTPPNAPESRTPEFETWRPAPGELVLRHRSGLTAARTRTAIDIGGTAASFDASFRRTFLTALARLLTWNDLAVVHGGAIAAGERAVLVLGGTGAGKSTLAFSALRAGWNVLADDLVAVRRSGSSAVIAGVPRLLAVPSDVLDDDSGTRPIADDHRRRRELPADAVVSGWFPLVGVIVVAHSNDADGAVEPIDPHALLHTVLGAWVPAEHGDRLRTMLSLAASIARRPAAVLRLGREPATRVEGSGAMLEVVRSRFGLRA